MTHGGTQGGTQGGTGYGFAPSKVPVEDASQVAVARDTAVRAARRLGFRDSRAETIALVTTELAENLHRHATGGELLIIPASTGLAVTAVDRGPGVAHFQRCLVDGYSTGGTMGTGLGAAVRLADDFDAVSEPGRGTVVRAAFVRDDVAFPGSFSVDAVGFPVEYEIENGDSWTSARQGERIVVLLADGLGHGPDAAAASRAAVEAFTPRADRPPAELMSVISTRIAATRGAAVSIASLDATSALHGGTVTTSGLGNVSVVVIAPDGTTRRLASSYGTAGASPGVRTRELTHDFPAGGVLVLHTDGLTSRWTLEDRAELLRHGPGVIAAALWRDHSRGRDDSLVVVVKGLSR